MKTLLLVIIGGGLGAGLRHLVGKAMLMLAGPSLPWGTFAVNIVGSLAMGLLAATLARSSVAGGGNDLRLLFGVGLLGGFTTFSAFSLELANMVDRGALLLAFGYALASVVIGVAALFAGLALVRAVA